MLNGLYGLVMLVGLWSISTLFFKYSLLRNKVYFYILPTNIAFWLFVSIPLLTYIIFPKIDRSVIIFQFHLISSLFMISIPLMIQNILNRTCYIPFWCLVSGISMGLFLFDWFIPGFSFIAKIVYTSFFALFFIFIVYIRYGTRNDGSIGGVYLNRFFYSTLFFFPGIFMDITGLTEFYFSGFICTPWFYLVIVGIIFTLPDSIGSNNQSQNYEQLLKPYNLTQRELEIIPLVLNGNSNQLIADELHISLSTVKRHVHNIFQKVDVTNRFELAQKIGR